MPVVNVQMYKGRPVEKKRKLAKALTEACVSILEIPPEAVTVVIDEYDKENWAVSGELASDKK